MDIYLDYNATTPIDPEVRDYMLPYLNDYFGNPSSIHEQGIQTKKAIEKARKQVADLLNCTPDEIIFTSGGTESNNYALKGIAFSHEQKGNHIITSQIEHPAVNEVCKYLEKKNIQVTYLPVDKYGLINPEELKRAIKQETILISIMHANNEIGTIQPINQLAKIAREHHIPFHTDAAQSCGKIPIDVRKTGIDLLSVAGHKLYAPKGIGVLYVKSGLQLEKIMHGADHERNMRPGTENVLEIVGLGKACEIAKRDLPTNQEKMKISRNLLYNTLKQSIPNIHLNGHPEQRLPNTLSISFPGIEANLILNKLTDEGIAASAGAACHTGEINVSSVLQATGLEEYKAMGTIRFSTGKHTSREEIDKAAKVIIDTVKSFSQTENPSEGSSKDSSIKLTHYTQGMGCACKLRPQELEKILKNVNRSNDPNILVDAHQSDDAAVYKINDEQAIVQTLDFFTPIIDDPFSFGEIAAANALSDIYAMGAQPIFALNIVGFPSARLPMSILDQILQGAENKTKEAGISILGGHSIDDPEPKFGMVVTGTAHPSQLLTNSGAKPGDSLILTKPIGTGILSTAMKRNLLETNAIQKITQVMSDLNKRSAEILRSFPVSACTDVTGFGLLGHLAEITSASGVNAELELLDIPVIQETYNFVAGGIVPGGTKNNLDFLKDKLIWDETIGLSEKYILSDAQTSGGLLFSTNTENAMNIIKQLQRAGVREASIIGQFTENGNGTIRIKK